MIEIFIKEKKGKKKKMIRSRSLKRKFSKRRSSKTSRSRSRSRKSLKRYVFTPSEMRMLIAQAKRVKNGTATLKDLKKEISRHVFLKRGKSITRTRTSGGGLEGGEGLEDGGFLAKIAGSLLALVGLSGSGGQATYTNSSSSPMMDPIVVVQKPLAPILAPIISGVTSVVAVAPAIPGLEGIVNVPTSRFGGTTSASKILATPYFDVQAKENEGIL